MNAPSKPRWFDTRFSIGNLITIAIMLFSIGAGWAALQSRLALQEERMSVGIAAATAERQRLENRVGRIEQDRSEIKDRLIRIETLMERMLRSVDGK